MVLIDQRMLFRKSLEGIRCDDLAGGGGGDVGGMLSVRNWSKRSCFLTA